ncbi:hypothetical protein ACQ3G7_08965 [Kosakonia oryzendophytica]|uniref:hypothetical protein n=1 Tax=Kosakonia oryzendophytica TaxID=1005665 RepID=UPI003D32F1F9
MKWPPAKRRKQSVALMLTALLATLAGAQLHRANAVMQQNVDEVTQFGFYDLMLRQKELYDSHMTTKGNTIQSNITSPDDNQFVLKGNFVQTRQQGKTYYFSYSPIYFMSSQNSRMINGNVDLLTHTGFWIQQYEADNVPLVSMQNGLIFLYPLDAR